MTTADLMVAKAASQVGYSSGSSTNSKYNVWYGMSNAYWCQIFVSWCANQAGVPNSVIPKAASTRWARQWFIDRGRWHSGSTGIKRGDLAYFFYSGRIGPVNHVGIVESVSGGKVTTIDGNWAGGRVYRRVATGIVGYGRPAYATPAPTPTPTTQEDDMGFYITDGARVAYYSSGNGKTRGLSAVEWTWLQAAIRGGRPGAEVQIITVAKGFFDMALNGYR